MRAARTLGSIAALLWATLSLAAGFRPPPSPAHYVTDNVGMLSPQVRQELDARLERYHADTGHQVVVWIGDTTGDVSIEEWAARTFEAWGIGKKGKDDGVALFVFASDRRLRIEVGYGLEGDIPDAIANRIIQEQAVPRLKAGDADGAIVASVDEILARIGGERSPPPRQPAPPAQYTQQPQPLSLGQLILFGIIGLFVLIFFITHPRLALWMLFSMTMGGGRRRGGGGWGGGGFGGGGFGGGGGRSGGGGASGSW